VSGIGSESCHVLALSVCALLVGGLVGVFDVLPDCSATAAAAASAASAAALFSGWSR